MRIEQRRKLYFALKKQYAQNMGIPDDSCEETEYDEDHICTLLALLDSRLPSFGVILKDAIEVVNYSERFAQWIKDLKGVCDHYRINGHMIDELLKEDRNCLHKIFPIAMGKNYTPLDVIEMIDQEKWGMGIHFETVGK